MADRGDGEIVDCVPSSPGSPLREPSSPDSVPCAHTDAAVLVDRDNLIAPYAVLIPTILYCAEVVCAGLLCAQYRTTDDTIWMSLTITFMLVPAMLTQLALTFIHRDLGRDRPFILFLHLLFLGPLIRCVEALVTYFRAGRAEEPYVTISRKISLKNGCGMPVEWEIGQAERKLAVHRNAFKRTAIIQAFLGSTPQLTLQLYATIQDKEIIRIRLILMAITLLSITYGALVCNILAIQIMYDDYKVRVRPAAFLCIILWRGLEISTRIIALVIFSTALTYWVVPVVLGNLLFFLLLPWVEFWWQHAAPPEMVEKSLSRLGTTVVLCLVTLLYACINIFCWSAVQLDLAHRDLIEKRPRWGGLAAYYSARFVENMSLIVLWYFFRTDFYEYVCAPLLVAQLLVCYGLAVLFMLLFYQYFHPCRSLFRYNVEDCLNCACCWQQLPQRTSASSFGHSSVREDSPSIAPTPSPPLTSQLGERETAILDDLMDTV